MAMTKRLRSLWLFICAMFLLVPATYATGEPGGEQTSASIRVTNQSFSGEVCTFHAALSGAEIEGTVFVTVTDANSGQMKSIAEYPANPELDVRLNRVQNADHFKAVWLDERYMPLAQSDVSLTSGANASEYDNYEDFSLAVLDMIQDYNQFSGSAVAQSGVQNTEYACARLIVKSESELPDLSEFSVARRLSDKEGHTVLQFGNPQDASDCAAYLKDRIPTDGVQNYVEEDRLVHLSPYEPREDADKVDASSLSWGVPIIHADLYAEYLLERNINRNITVAVVDTGVDYNHQFLSGRVLNNGYDYVDNDDDPMDEHYHGTHVAGTVVDTTPGLTNLKIMPVRVLDGGGSGTFLNVSFGIRYAADHGADVINMSLGGGHSSVVDEAVDYAVNEKNVTIVVAAGNASDDAEYHCPAHIRQCITVAAVNSNLIPANFSNYGQAVDLAAPGVDIKSSVPNNRYEELNGTSMASPHVAACAAMLREEFPNITPAETERELVNAVQVPAGWDSDYGPGIVDMAPFIQNAPETYLYAIVYSDGEMVFQNSPNPEPGRTPLHDAYAISAVGAQYAGWYPLRESVTKVTFAEEVHPASTALWFYGFKNLRTVQDVGNLKTDGVTNMSQMFSRCDSLETLDLRGMDTGNVTNMRQMFFGCGSLETILASDSFSVQNVEDGVDMFTGCVQLRGENGTVYNSSHTDHTYARLDGGSSSPGYFSSQGTAGPSETLYAVLYSNGELKFQTSAEPESGRTYTNSYTTDSGGYDHDITNFAAWYNEREQIRSVTFGTSIYPTSTALWFYDCENLTAINNPGLLHTSYVTDMSQMFQYCSSLTSLDLDGFNTSNTVNMASMFRECTALERIYATDAFTTDNVNDSENMFTNCTSLVGGMGTPYSVEHVDKTYARVDSSSAAGYFTAR